MMAREKRLLLPGYLLKQGDSHQGGGGVQTDGCTRKEVPAPVGMRDVHDGWANTYAGRGNFG